ncbi:MAG: cell division protein ZapA [Pseudomonadota bacterium]
MAQVDVTVNGREYRITCDDGQESRLMRLAGHYDNRVREIADDLGQIGDARLMLLAALTVCDDWFELKERVADLEKASDALDPETTGAAGRAIEAAASRVREIAASLDAT